MVRNILRLLKTLFLGLLLSGVAPLAAQHEAPMTRRWGGWVALETHLLGVGAAGNQPWDQPDVWAQSPVAGWGFGVYRSFPLGRRIGLQPAVSIAANRQAVYFSAEGGATLRQSYAFADLECAAHLIWTDKAGRMPLQGYVLLGPRLGWNVARQPRDPGMGMLRERLAIDAGLGLSFPLRSRWMLEPGIVYSQGLFSVHDHVNRPYDDRVGRVLRDRISIRLAISRRPPPATSVPR